MSGLYAADGSFNVTVVDGTTRTGLYASDGSWNVIASLGTSMVGVYHPCGALYVTVLTSGAVGHYAADGSWNITQTPFGAPGATRVTVVAGSFGGGTPGTGYTYYILGF